MRKKGFTKKEFIEATKEMGDDCQLVLCLISNNVSAEGYVESVEWDEGEITITAHF